ncbi:hypothetical protein ACFWUP_28960 [Nocardia sp. NPDC058658]|uniref:DUF7691 family protein n=1 Tax=Nocardia sp. NPDC058658 TaxID=3346580 RepID=UPI003669D641
MSHILHVYLVDLAEVEAVIGSKDEKFLNRLIAELSDDHDPADGCCEPCDLPDCAGPDCEECDPCEDARHPRALRTIFDGGPFDEDHADAYISALELICADIGRDIGDASFWFGYDGLPDEILSLATDMDGEDPFPFTDSNGWGHIDKESCAEQLAEWETIAAGPDDHGGYADCIVEWFRESKAADKDLVGFWAG